MPETVRCECGARVRLPEGAAGPFFRCPRCKADLPTAEAGLVIVAEASPVAPGGASCPICQTAIGPDEPLQACPECGQVHHRECWVEVGGCGTYGCKHAPSLKGDEPLESAPRAAWGDTKKCPACHETIKAIALRCRYCGTDFDTVDPLSVADLEQQAEIAESQRKARTSVTILFVLSVIGCLAPVMVFIDLAWVLGHRQVLAKAGPAYVVLGYASIIMSVVYSTLILGFYLFSLA
jgi:hypothetical protein